LGIENSLGNHRFTQTLTVLLDLSYSKNMCIQSRPISSSNSFNTFDFSTFYYTVISHSKLKVKFKGASMYKKLFVLGNSKYYFVNKTRILTKSSLKSSL